MSDGSKLFGEVSDWIGDSDLAVLNLECPLTQSDTALDKTGPNLKGSPCVLEAVRQAGFSLVGLANNHILDYGEKGVRETLEHLHRRHIGYFGAGASLTEARQFSIQDINGLRVAFCGMAEHEFSIAADESFGANPLDLITFQREIRAQKGTYDALIVLLHGGAEHYPYPTPEQQRTCRFLVECGASAVVCQHSHCAGCLETYEGKPIVYGQGNFFFPKARPMSDAWSCGILLKIEITLQDGEEKVGVKILPTQQKEESVNRMSPEAESVFLGAFKDRSGKVVDESHVREQWKKWCSEKMDQYIPMLLGYGRIRRRVYSCLRHGLLLKYKRRLLTLKNIVSCETHRESVLDILHMASNPNK